MDALSATSDGKRLAFKRWAVQRSVYVAGLNAEGTRITTAVRITHSESNDLPVAWTPGSDAVLFLSNRSGSWGIYRQFLKQEVAEPIVTGLEQRVLPSISPDGTWLLLPSISPDGAWLLYVIPAKEHSSGMPYWLMRVPITGGPPQQVLTASTGSQRCAKSPSTICALAERTPDLKQLTFTGFDSVKGRGRELTRYDIDPNASYVWDLSPDGSRIALHKRGDRRIYLLSPAGQTARALDVKGWSSFETLNWAADGKGLFAASRNQESSVLLYIDLRQGSHCLGAARNFGERVGWNLGNTFPGRPSPGDDGLYPECQHGGDRGFLKNSLSGRPGRRVAAVPRRLANPAATRRVAANAG
jgi:Tol biopolymer transport system component